MASMLRCFVVLCTILQLLHLARGAVVKKTIEIAWKSTSLDGFSRRVIVMNGNTPGPTLKCFLGDTLQVTIVNKLDAPVSLHWHGVRQLGSAEMDGVPGVTQRAIASQATFVYTFKPSHPGTYWYHSHFHAEYVDGLRGTLIVIDKKAKSYKRDSVVMLTDWFADESDALLKNVVLKKKGTGVEPLPVSGLIQGIGQRLGSACSRGCPNSCAKTGATKDCPACKSGETPKPCMFKQVQAQPGGSCTSPATKLRFINGAGYTGFSVSIDEHLMQIVAADVFPVKAVTVGTLYINVGQRHEVLVCRKTNPTSLSPAWIRVRYEGLNPFPPQLVNKDFLGILTYTTPKNVTNAVLPKTKADAVLFSTGVKKTYPQVNDPLKRKDLDPTGLQLVKPIPPPKATQVINYTIAFGPDPKTEVFRAYINGISFSADLSGTPLLEIEKQGKPIPTNVPGLHIDNIKKGSVVDIFIKNLDYRIHPMHMHGYDVWVMARGKTGALATLKNFPTLDKNPMMRDTVTVMPQSYIVLRIKADNPGFWLMHCHVEWHIAAGMVNLYHVK